MNIIVHSDQTQINIKQDIQSQRFLIFCMRYIRASRDPFLKLFENKFINILSSVYAANYYYFAIIYKQINHKKPYKMTDVKIQQQILQQSSNFERNIGQYLVSLKLRDGAINIIIKDNKTNISYKAQLTTESINELFKGVFTTVRSLYIYIQNTKNIADVMEISPFGILTIRVNTTNAFTNKKISAFVYTELNIFDNQNLSQINTRQLRKEIYQMKNSHQIQRQNQQRKYQKLKNQALQMENNIEQYKFLSIKNEQMIKFLFQNIKVQNQVNQRLWGALSSYRLQIEAMRNNYKFQTNQAYQMQFRRYVSSQNQNTRTFNNQSLQSTPNINKLKEQQSPSSVKIQDNITKKQIFSQHKIVKYCCQSQQLSLKSLPSKKVKTQEYQHCPNSKNFQHKYNKNSSYLGDKKQINKISNFKVRKNNNYHENMSPTQINNRLFAKQQKKTPFRVKNLNFSGRLKHFRVRQKNNIQMCQQNGDSAQPLCSQEQLPRGFYFFDVDILHCQNGKIGIGIISQKYVRKMREQKDNQNVFSWGWTEYSIFLTLHNGNLMAFGEKIPGAGAKFQKKGKIRVIINQSKNQICWYQGFNLAAEHQIPKQLANQRVHAFVCMKQKGDKICT